MASKSSNVHMAVAIESQNERTISTSEIQKILNLIGKQLDGGATAGRLRSPQYAETDSASGSGSDVHMAIAPVYKVTWSITGEIEA